MAQSGEIPSEGIMRFAELSNEVDQIVHAGIVKIAGAFEDWRAILAWSRFTSDLNLACLRYHTQEGTRC